MGAQFIRLAEVGAVGVVGFIPIAGVAGVVLTIPGRLIRRGRRVWFAWIVWGRGYGAGEHFTTYGPYGPTPLVARVQHHQNVWVVGFVEVV